MLKRTGLYAESWNVAWRKTGTGTILNDINGKFSIIENEFRYWAADPFLFKHNGENYIFAELYDYVKCRGTLGYCKWNGQSFGKWKQVISEEYHLSYPFIFEDHGQIYIMPESGANHNLYLYRAVKFPDIWEKSYILRESVKYGDTTPFVWKNHRYALTYDVRDANAYRLVLLDLEDETGDCVLKNLDCVELRRPAGREFILDEKHIRPAQNCSNDYGEGLVFYEFDMKEDIYRENMIKSIFPNDLNFSRKILLDGMHTYNSTDEFEVIDLKTRRFNLLNLCFRVWRKIKR